jgi:hypothetical protein
MGLNKRLIDQAGGGSEPSSPLDIATWTGDGNDNRQISVSNNPDFVIVKRRSFLSSWLWNYEDGSNIKFLSSNNANEASDAGDGVKSLNDGSFTLGTGGLANDNGQTCVGYSFQGGGSYVSNTDGSITSQVSANQDSGFSIVKWTGNSTAGATIGTGLSLPSQLIIIKNLNVVGGSSKNWTVYAEPLGNTDYLYLNSTGQAQTYNFWNNTSPVSDKFTVSSDTNVNSSSGNYIAYCFHSVDGYQKIGSYTGTGTTSSFTGFGFQPRFIMIKRTDASSNWWIFDSERGNNKGLRPNLINGDDTTDANGNTYEYRINFISDGFQYEIDNSTSPHPDLNAHQVNYVYLAIA